MVSQAVIHGDARAPLCTGACFGRMVFKAAPSSRLLVRQETAALRSDLGGFMPGTATRRKRRKNRRAATSAKVGEKAAPVQVPCFTHWPLSYSKRVLDVVIASSLLILLTPLMALIAVAIKLSSPGPVFFCRARVGRFGEHFPMLKFRSMVADCDGPGLTCKDDARVTRVGRILRKFKMDELPQLINVLQGHMSMVGPRPHLPEVFALEPHHRHFLQLRPGITGAASFRFRREEDLLIDMPWKELRNYYISSILPEKVGIELQYATSASCWTDLKLIVLTAVYGLIRFDRNQPKASDNLIIRNEEHQLKGSEPSENMAA